MEELEWVKRRKLNWKKLELRGLDSCGWNVTCFKTYIRCHRWTLCSTNTNNTGHEASTRADTSLLLTITHIWLVAVAQGALCACHHSTVDREPDRSWKLPATAARFSQHHQIIIIIETSRANRNIHLREAQHACVRTDQHPVRSPFRGPSCVCVCQTTLAKVLQQPQLNRW